VENLTPRPSSPQQVTIPTTTPETIIYAPRIMFGPLQKIYYS